MSNHVLRLNQTILSAGDGPSYSDDGTWWLDVYGRNFTTGSPESVNVTMRTLLQDGARVITTRRENREPSFYVVVGGVNSAALAEAERVLALQMGRRGELGWLPPDGWAPETVFDIETSQMDPDADDEADLREVKDNERVYVLQFICQPFARAAEKTVSYAPPPASVPLDEDVLDPGTSLARWTAVNGALEDNGPYLQMYAPANPRARFTPAAPYSLASQPYISLVSNFGGLSCFVNGVQAQLVGFEGATIPPSSAGVRYYWRTDETVVNSIEFLRTATGFAALSDLRVRNLPPGSSTPRQSVRVVAVDGSVRTQGNLLVAAPEGAALGSTMLYTSTAASPLGGLRPNRISGPNVPSPDATAVSGASEFISSGPTFELPVTSVADGKHQLIARLKRGSGTGALTTDLTWTAATFVAGTQVGPKITGVTSITISEAWSFKVISNVDLPVTDLPADSTATVRLTFEASNVSLDDAWALNLDEGAVTIVEADGRRRLWVETANIERPRPAIYVGNAADKSDAFHDPAFVVTWGVHEFAPSLTTALIVTAGCDNPEVSFEFYRRYLNFVADPVSL